MLEVNKIYQGDALEVLKTFPDECIDLIISSPPYYGLRNYGVDGQIGLEDTFEEYLGKMLLITNELKRVLKPTGQFWLNMGDCYGGSGMGMSYAGHTKGPNSILPNKLDYMPEVGHVRGNMDKCLLMQPERMAIAMIDQQGWILRNKVKWAKQVLIKKQNKTIGSVMPSSVRDRFNESGEELYFFVKNKKYYSDLDAVRMKNQVLGISDLRSQQEINKYPVEYQKGKRYKADGQNHNNRGIIEMRKERDWKQEEAEGYKMGSVDPHRAALRGGLKSLAQRMQDTKNKNSKESPSYNMKKLLSEVRLGIKPNAGMIPKDRNEHLRMKSAPQPNEPNAFNEMGKNIPTIWQIQPEPHNFQREIGVEIDHFATFPQALVEIPIKFGCPKNGIVLDPFGGAMTTAVVAKKLKRKWIMIELNPKYIELGQKRISGQEILI